MTVSYTHLVLTTVDFSEYRKIEMVIKCIKFIFGNGRILSGFGYIAVGLSLIHIWKLYSIYALGHILQGSPEADEKYLKILFKYLMGKECNFDNPQTYRDVYKRQPIRRARCGSC